MKTKSLIALILSLSLLAPVAALQACSTNEEGALPSDSAQASPLPEDDAQEEGGSAPTTPTTPTTPSVPSSPSVTPPKDEAEQTPSKPPVSTKAQYVKLTANSVNIRSGAGTNYKVLGSGEKDTRYAIIGQTGNWYKTYYRNQTAYVYASYGSIFSLEKTDDEDVENVIAEGYKLLGTPYVYGAVRFHDGNGNLLKGFSVTKFDCSSLMQYIFYKGAGTLLKSHSRAQVLQGKYVKRADLQRGDCLFFTNESRKNKTGIERVGHVALYLGDGYILHTASDYARIEPITQSRWNYYIEARRFL